MKIPMVSQLYNVAKIKFSPASDGGGIRDIKLNEKKLTFYLPVITLNINSEVILRNLVAYEVLSAKPCSTLEFAQYVDLMSGTIDDAEDVRLLRKMVDSCRDGELDNYKFERVSFKVVYDPLDFNSSRIYRFVNTTILQNFFPSQLGEGAVEEKMVSGFLL
ncbi:hypothetical protein F0562_030256 [Nyssa sinensis]|uniref:Uncharacterized protein n=1 Tax=Nyssa sinensis TaxID=561372 RepID=A0A5J5AWF8_9ASTE|nr:hypothetical protein F0562_030256 [Nyssa sinensis]